MTTKRLTQQEKEDICTHLSGLTTDELVGVYKDLHNNPEFPFVGNPKLAGMLTEVRAELYFRSLGVPTV